MEIAFAASVLMTLDYDQESEQKPTLRGVETELHLSENLAEDMYFDEGTLNEVGANALIKTLAIGLGATMKVACNRGLMVNSNDLLNKTLELVKKAFEAPTEPEN